MGWGATVFGNPSCGSEYLHHPGGSRGEVMGLVLVFQKQDKPTARHPVFFFRTTFTPSIIRLSLIRVCVGLGCLYTKLLMKHYVMPMSTACIDIRSRLLDFFVT